MKKFIAKNMPRETLDEILSRGVFHKGNLAVYDVHEFKPAKVSDKILSEQ